MPIGIYHIAVNKFWQWYWINDDMQHYTLMFEDAVDTVMKFIIIDTYLDLIYDMICNT